MKSEEADKLVQESISSKTNETIAKNFSRSESIIRQKLSYAENDALTQKFVLNASDEEIADHLKIPVETIPLLVEAAIEKLATDPEVYALRRENNNNVEDSIDE
jgi:DNA-directed RNA polymerase specialized sigma24 family protein